MIEPYMWYLGFAVYAGIRVLLNWRTRRRLVADRRVVASARVRAEEWRQKIALAEEQQAKLVALRKKAERDYAILADNPRMITGGAVGAELDSYRRDLREQFNYANRMMGYRQ